MHRFVAAALIAMAPAQFAAAQGSAPTSNRVFPFPYETVELNNGLRVYMVKALHELPAGRSVVEAVEDEAPALSPEEEAGIEAALESYRQGRVVDAKRAREIIDAALGR